MKRREIGKLAGFSLAQGARVLLDRTGDNLGIGLPYKPQQVLDPATLSSLLNDYSVRAPKNADELSRTRYVDFRPPLSDIQVRDVKSISSNCQNLILDVNAELADGERGPTSLFLKLPMDSLATHWFFSLIGSWQLECYFCRHIAPRIPFRTPHTYAVHSAATRFFLLQENLLDDDSVRLFTNLDMQQGAPIDVVYQCLDTFAKLHASHFNLGAVEREQILPNRFHPFLGPQTGRVSRALNTYGLAPCLKKAPGRIPDEIVAAYRRSLVEWDTLLAHWFSGPLSLLHGDSHLGNFFVSGDEMGMLDFQAVHWGKGSRDVLYFLADSLPSTVLADNEREFIRYYVDRREHYGAAISFEQCWDEYRSFAYHALMTIVVSIGFGALNEEQDTLMLELLDRAVAAAIRLDYPGWLDSFLARDWAA